MLLDFMLLDFMLLVIFIIIKLIIFSNTHSEETTGMHVDDYDDDEYELYYGTHPNHDQNWPNKNYELLHKITMNMSVRQKQQFFHLFNQLDFKSRLPLTLNQLENAVSKQPTIKFSRYIISGYSRPLYQNQHEILLQKEVCYFSRKLWGCVEEIINQKNLVEHATWNFDDDYGGRKYSELTSGKYFKKVQEKITKQNKKDKILLLIIAVDETQYNSKSDNLCPVYVTVGNIPVKQRNLMAAKKLLGFLPVLMARKKLSQQPQYIAFKRKVKLIFVFFFDIYLPIVYN